MASRHSIHGLQIDAQLAAFIEEEALPGTEVSADAFWRGLAGLIADFGPRNHALLRRHQGWRLSPAYDLVPTPVVSRERRDLALTLGNNAVRHPSRFADG